ncbi:hypothetical protein ROS217_02100 [Roseovarius sp. 217]|nr:hypothetical protein ROS217_02100 [Roseovarius sp. 217]
MKATEFDERFDAGEDMSAHVDGQRRAASMSRQSG